MSQNFNLSQLLGHLKSSQPEQAAAEIKSIIDLIVQNSEIGSSADEQTLELELYLQAMIDLQARYHQVLEEMVNSLERVDLLKARLITHGSNN